jgi:hypothetical protein
VLAPAKAPQFVQPSFGDRLDRLTDWRTLIWIPLLILGVALLAWVVIREFRGRVNAAQIGRRPAPASGPNLHSPPESSKTAATQAGQRFAGGPRQVSVQLKASEPARRRGETSPAEPVAARGEDVADAEPAEAVREPADALRDEEAVGPVFEQPSMAPASTEADQRDGGERPETMLGSLQAATEPLEADSAAAPRTTTRYSDFDESVGPVMEQPSSVDVAGAAEVAQDAKEEVLPPSDIPEAPSAAAAGSSGEPVLGALRASEDVVSQPTIDKPPATEADEPEAEITPESKPLESTEAENITAAETTVRATPPPEAVTEPEPEDLTVPAMKEPILPETGNVPAEPEPVAQGQPVPYQTPAAEVEPEKEIASPVAAESEMVAVSSAIAGLGALRGAMGGSAETEEEPTKQFSSQPTHIHTMPETVQTPPAPVIRTPAGAPQTAPSMGPQAAAGGMHTAVHITLSCEIASMQLTPTFKMGALQLRPISKVVTMRLASSQQQQNGMNVQLNFEIAKVQPAPGSLGQVRLTPSQQQKPASLNTPSFNISGLQVVSGFEQAPLQLTPSQQGQASVLLTAAFQITTVEFSPTFDIAAMILNSSSKTVAVQLPGAGGTGDGPLFEVTNVQLASNGEIGMLQLNPAATRRS